MFADGMKKRREALGLSQQALSKLSGVPQSTISAVESGARIPKEDTMVMIAAGLRCTVGELLGECEDKVEPDGSTAGLDAAIVQLMSGLEDSDYQRMLDFASGLIAARKEPPSPK